MTKQNYIHKLVVVRERCYKEICKSLSGIPCVYVKRRKTYCKAFYRRKHREDKHCDKTE